MSSSMSIRIDFIADIRYLNTSQNKPEYSGEALQKRLIKIGCRYQHYPEHALPFPILDAYRAKSLRMQLLQDICTEILCSSGL